MASPKALVTPKLLVWAREKSHLPLEAAAKKLGVKSHQLEAWEAGDDHPTMKQLYKISHIYQRPLSFFYLDELPKDFSVAITDFRRQSVRDDLPYELIKELRLAQERRLVALELLQEADEQPPDFPYLNSLDLNTDVEEASQRVRDWLGISMELQTRWNNRSVAFQTWRSAIEMQNVLVFEISAQRYSLPITVASGFSLKAEHLPVIVVNGHDPINRRTFTLIHEFVHLGLRSENQAIGICDTWQHNPREHHSTQSIELVCNSIAGKVLVPKAHFLQLARGKLATDEKIVLLADKFQVSREVIIRRMLELGLIDYSYYRERSGLYWNEWVNRDKPGNRRAPPRARVVVRANGATYVRIVLSAYAERRISTGDAAWFLNTKAKHLPRIQQFAGV